MTATDIINNILAGGLLGALGQGIRIAVGLKKFNENNAIQIAQDKPAEEFSTSRLIISIFIGFVAGALGMLIEQPDDSKKKHLDTQAIITIIAIGYSGADFIEGVFNAYIKKVVPGGSVSGLAANSNSATTSVTDQPATVPDEANFTNSPAQG